MQPAVNPIAATDVHEILGQHILADGYPMVLDMVHSKGPYLRDLKTGKDFIDFFGFYASNALGMNHPGLTENEPFKERLMEAAMNKIANSDIYTPHFARFIQTFSRVGIPDYLPYTFFVSGGALAVENALKTAFDWKVQKNFMKGYRHEKGMKVMHFDQAFHGRSGYTLSLTNTADPRKTQYFPKFDWPRISNPKVHFPITEENLPELQCREMMAMSQAKQFFQTHKDDIACIIVEPVQGEGGDNHFRQEFLQELKDLAHENDALLVFDEVQTGVGISGEFWLHQAVGVTPDIIAFGKKAQVCGILAGKKLDEVHGHVFQTSSRINSTWGGNLVDMVRFDRILEVIEEENLVQNSATVGAYLKTQLHGLAANHAVISNVRGLGLMCAFDLPSGAFRDAVVNDAYEKGLVVLGCGDRTIRFRSPLTVTPEQIDIGLQVLEASIKDVAVKHAA